VRDRHLEIKIKRIMDKETEISFNRPTDSKPGQEISINLLTGEHVTNTSINFLQPILQNAWISNIANPHSSDDDDRVLGLSLLGDFGDGVDFNNPLLNAYKNDLLKRVSEFSKSVGYAKLKEIQGANADFIRENQELCARWAKLIIEARGLNRIAGDGITLDAFNLTDRLFTGECDDGSIRFV